MADPTATDVHQREIGPVIFDLTVIDCKARRLLLEAGVRELSQVVRNRLSQVLDKRLQAWGNNPNSYERRAYNESLTAFASCSPVVIKMFGGSIPLRWIEWHRWLTRQIVLYHNSYPSERHTPDLWEAFKLMVLVQGTA